MEYPDLEDELTFEIAVSRELGAGPDASEYGRANITSIVNHQFDIEELECFHAAMDGIEMPLLDEGDYTVRRPYVFSTGRE